MIILNRVKELRARHDMTQSELAEAVDVTRQTIAALEKGRYIPSLLLAMQISKRFNQPIEEIFYEGEEE